MKTEEVDGIVFFPLDTSEIKEEEIDFEVLRKLGRGIFIMISIFRICRVLVSTTPYHTREVKNNLWYPVFVLSCTQTSPLPLSFLLKIENMGNLVLVHVALFRLG